MMDDKQTVLDILKDLTGEDFSDNLDEDLYSSALLDSMGTVQLLLDLQDKLGVQAPVSEFDRNEWNTPAKIIAKVEASKWVLKSGSSWYLGRFLQRHYWCWRSSCHHSGRGSVTLIPRWIKMPPRLCRHKF